MKVLGFPIDDFDRNKLDEMTDIQLNETFLENSNCISYDSVKSFFNDLNDDLVDIDNNWWFVVKID
jgi:hypothetical protein